jgi:hypothetical protein
MTEANLATCFMPCLFRRENPDKNDPFKEMIEAKSLSRVLE